MMIQKINSRLFKYSACLIGAAVFFLLLPFLRGIGHKAVPTGFTVSSPRVVVIDAGHGGEDGGAVSQDGVAESALNLDIAKKLDTIMGFYGAPAVMTRDSEKLDYPEGTGTTRSRKTSDIRRRTELVNNTPNALLISIHLNKFPDSQQHGAQVFYANTDGSRELAQFTQETLRALLEPSNRRQAKLISKDIYLMNNIKCPAILVECGFLSNPADTALLKTEGYRLKVACSIACSYFSYFWGNPADENKS